MFLCRFLLLFCFAISNLWAEVSFHRVWQETSKGRIVIEAESLSFPENSQWVIEDSLTDFTGEGYIRFTGGNSVFEDVMAYEELAQAARLQGRVQSEKPGYYHFRVRNRHNSEDGDNDMWLSYEGGDWYKIHDSDAGEWTEDESSRGDWNNWLLGGAARVAFFEVGGRSTNFTIDRFVLSSREDTVESLTEGEEVYTEMALLDGEPYLWSEAEILADGLRKHDPFGYFYDAFMPWCYFWDLGWLYCSNGDLDGFFAYRLNDGWIWTSQTYYPWLYDYRTMAWVENK